MKNATETLNPTGKNFLRRFMPLLVLAAVCVSCSGGSDSNGGSDSAFETAKTGTFIDSVVEGLEYRTPTQSGITGSNGMFENKNKETVTFSIGAVVIGQAMAKAYMNPIDIVAEAVDETHPAVVNICRFLQSLDEDGNVDERITISETIRYELKGSPPINFNQSPEDFSNDVDVQTLFDTLNALGVFPSGDRELVSAAEAVGHLRIAAMEENNSIYIRSPNGGEKMVTGGAYEITWVGGENTANVTIRVGYHGRYSLRQ